MTTETKTLDERIAEHLGWNPGTECNGDIIDYDGNPLCLKCGCMPEWGHTEHEENCPPYSTDIAAAFDLVEEMAKRGYCMKLECDVPPDGITTYRCIFVDASGTWQEGASMAEAIVKAALCGLDSEPERL